MVSSPKLLFPIGHMLGPVRPEVDATPTGYAVRVGREAASLSLSEFAVWAYSFGMSPRVDEEPWTRKVVEELAVAAGIADAKLIVDRLLEVGVLAEVELRTASTSEFARAYRMFPLMIGLGNRKAEPWLFEIGLTDSPVVSVTVPLYTLWSRAAAEGSLEALCAAVAAENLAAEVTSPAETDEAELLHGFLSGLHGLLSVNSAYLDTAAGIRGDSS